MRRPHWRTAMFSAVTGIIGLTLLVGCTTRPSGISAGDEAARYLQNARGRYVIPGPPRDPWGPYIRKASARFDMPETWIRALMRQESGGSLYRNGRLITSSAGAMGLMQVMPGTYRELRARHNLGPDPFEPHDNIMAGVAYMREMYDMYGAPGFLAAYNAGPNRLDDYLANQRGLPDETRKYVAAIGPALRHAAPRVRSPAEQYAMNQLPLHIPPGPRFGYGAVQVPTVQVAAATSYRQPVQTSYTPPAPQPRPVAVAYAAPPPSVVYAAPAPVGRSIPLVEPPRQVQAPPPVQRTLVAQAHAAPTRLAMARNQPVRRGGRMHLISTAVAAEAVTAKHVKRSFVGKKASFVKPARPVKRSVVKQRPTIKAKAVKQRVTQMKARHRMKTQRRMK